MTKVAKRVIVCFRRAGRLLKDDQLLFTLPLAYLIALADILENMAELFGRS
ncbi:MAG: hypothetical protein JWQ36_1621 [Enterovirga sp.]|jgi:hypothetical protein|nr:hypothetical protein [Enterovirga sp.]